MSAASRPVIVGGGIAGLVAALRLARSGASVVLLEREMALGGLLRSRRLPTGQYVDQGTHFLADTGIEDLDVLVRSMLPASELRRLAPLQAGTFAFGRLNVSSASLDIRGLGRDLEAQIVAEALCTEENGQEASDLATHVMQLFGSTALRTVFDPIFKKLCGVGCAELAPDAMRLFSLARLVALNPAATRRLKSTPHGDARFSFHSNDEGKNPASAYYPTHGGIGRWTEALARAVQDEGVEVRLGTSVQRVTRHRDSTVSLSLSNGDHLASDLLVWSVPSGMLLRALGEPPESMPQVRASIIEHFVFDRPFLVGAHYVHTYGPDVGPFRVTLYPNFTDVPSEGFACTVETFAEATASVPLDQHADQSHADLVRMGLVDPRATRLWSDAPPDRAAFPVWTKNHRLALLRQRERVEQLLPECILIGRATGKDFFMTDVLRDTWRRCDAVLQQQNSLRASDPSRGGPPNDHAVLDGSVRDVA
ncbi:MAG: FAD-dependent oxidoreductase [Deltaproteobacteria bacterium]|nr:FAD-dependent oxidoreductase [Deltaproteobacteria bacterium]